MSEQLINDPKRLREYLQTAHEGGCNFGEVSEFVRARFATSAVEALLADQGQGSLVDLYSALLAAEPRKVTATTGLLTVYARYEPTKDDVTLQLWPDSKKRDVVIYRDKECSRYMGRYDWTSSNKPTRNHKTITMNCYKWKVEWLPDLLSEDRKLKEALSVAGVPIDGPSCDNASPSM